MADFEVVCPIRNAGAHFAATLRSLCGQGGEGYALLVSDNFSTDGNPWREVLAELTDWEVRTLQPPQALGRVEHWSWACAQSTATFTKLLMAGDQAEPGALHALRSALDARPATSFAFGQCRTRELDKEFLAGPQHVGGDIGQEEFIMRSLTSGNFTNALSAVAFRTTALQAALPFDPEHPWTADWRLCLRAVQRGACYYLPRPVCLLDRTIARFSSRASTIAPSLREEWQFQRELAALSPGGDTFAQQRKRMSHLCFQAAVKYGRAWLPSPLRKFLGSILKRAL